MGMDRILDRLRKGEGPPLRVSELADVIGASRSYVHKLIDAGTLHPGRVGREYRIHVEEAAQVARDAGALRD
jgi:excisionase family DNA binding protein